MKKPIIHVERLSKSYKIEQRVIHALHHVDLTIYSGEAVAIMGASGSGKSTLLHLLGCLDHPTTGKYLLNGQEVNKLDEKALAFIRASKIGFVFQSYNLIPQLNVFENVEIPFLYQSHLLSKKEIRERIFNAIECVKLEDRLHHLPSQLSGGESQRVAIARALVIQPLLILADEPTGNLDSKTGEIIMDLFQTLNKQGVTLVIVTHDEKVGSYCRRIIRMKDGQVESFNDKTDGKYV